MSHNTPFSVTSPTMDFLKSCTTGVELMPGFTSVQYWVYTAEKNDGIPSTGNIKSLGDVLMEAEIILRNRKHLVYHDAARPALWIFGGAAKAPFAQHPDMDTIPMTKWGYALKTLFSGMFKASELNQHLNKTTAPGVPTQWQPSSQPPTPGGALNDLTSRMNPNAASNARAFQQNAAMNLGGPKPAVSQINDVRSTYIMFNKAVTSCYAYSLARDFRTFQLDPRTFVYSPAPLEGVVRPAQSTVFTLDNYLASGGGLLVSINVVDAPPLYPLGKHTLRQDEVLIVPGGLSATVLDTRPPDNSADVAKWKSFIHHCLRQRGIQIIELDPEEQWILVRSRERGPTAFYWPKVLCFSREDRRVVSEEAYGVSQAGLPLINGSRSLDPFSWFSSPAANGFIDPFRFAEDWFQGKASRDKIIEDRKRKKWEIEMAKKQAENASLSATSPLYTRGDLQATAGVYPTPPDAILSQVASAPGFHDLPPMTVPTDAGAQRTSIDMHHTEMMDLDMGAFGGDTSRQRASIISRGSVHMDAGMKIGDDLFGDIDEEEFGGQDITDADFSFFDEPDTVMEDISADGDASDPVKKENDTPAADDPGAGQIEIQRSPMSGAAADVETSPIDDPTSETAEVDFATLEKVEETPRPNPVEESVIVRDRLNPASVRKHLFDFALKSAGQDRRGSEFEPVAFNTALQENDAKYGFKGAFAFKIQTGPKQPTSIEPLPPEGKKPRLSMVPQTSPQRAMAYESEGDSSDSGSEDEEGEYTWELREFVQSPVKANFAGGDEMMDVDSPFGNGPVTVSMPKDVAGQTRLLASILRLAESSGGGNDEPKLQRRFTLGPNSSVISDMPPFVQSDGPLNPLHKDFINVAQIITEQLSFGFLNTFTGSKLDQPYDSKISTSETSPAAFQSIMEAIRGCCDTMSRCDLLKYLSIQEAPPDKPNLKGHPQAQQKKAMTPGLNAADGTPVPSQTLVLLQPPHVRVRRNDNLWDVLPPALPFWEQLGLAPAAGKKNVMAFCIYPGNDDLRSQVVIFLDYLAATFDSCKLGAHVRASSLAGIKDGLVPVHLTGDHTLQAAVSAIRDVCAGLGKSLASVDWSSKIDFTPPFEDMPKIDSLVIYIVNPFENNPRALMELCAAFWALYETYRKPSSIPQIRPDIVLQILPVRYIASPYNPVAMPAPFMQNLAREVYDRCPLALPDNNPSRLLIHAGSAIQLEPTLPRKIDFKLQAEPPADLSNESSHLHLGYAKSENGEWLTVVWVDGTGRYQACNSYFCGGRGFGEVAGEVWEATVEIMRVRRVAWRVCVAKVGGMAREELDAWSKLATAVSNVLIITVITTIDPFPALTLFPTPNPSPATHPLPPKPGGNVYTPIHTPQPTASPDTTLTPAATPLPDTTEDTDAHLVDLNDETWGLIMSHRTNVAGSGVVGEYRPALSSGYILTMPNILASGASQSSASGLVGQQAPGLVGVNLVWIGSSHKSSAAGAGAGGGENMGGRGTGMEGTSTNVNAIPKFTADSILRDYLGVFRGLGVLGRARGVGGGVGMGAMGGVEGVGAGGGGDGDLRGMPWHVAVALKSVRGLERGFGTLVGS